MWKYISVEFITIILGIAQFISKVLSVHQLHPVIVRLKEAVGMLLKNYVDRNWKCWTKCFPVDFGLLFRNYFKKKFLFVTLKLVGIPSSFFNFSSTYVLMKCKHRPTWDCQDFSFIWSKQSKFGKFVWFNPITEWEKFYLKLVWSLYIFWYLITS